MMFRMILLSVMVCIGLSACAGKSSQTVKAMQRKDKNLSCKEILLEMNEAEFYKRTAEKNRTPNLKNVLMPLGYISTYMSSEEAVASAHARVEYLDRIYQIMNCDGRQEQSAAPSVIGGGRMGGGDYLAPVQSNRVEYRQPQEESSMAFYPEGMYW